MKQLERVLPFPWSVLFFLTTSFVYIYSFMEWIFFVTKPSFMSGMSLGSQLQIYFLSALGMSVFPLLLIILLSIIHRFVNNWVVAQISVAVGTAVAALIISCLILILVDNFTYTVFKFGVVSTERIPRALYGLLFLLLFVIAFYRINRYVQARGKKKYPVRRNQQLLLIAFLSISSFFAVVSIFADHTSTVSTATGTHRDHLPNIILLGSDGLDATHLSVYGYERDTTPRMKAVLPKALVVENDFSNGGTTAGSVASILTGKLPIETRVIYPPDILDGEDSYQHLPGMLKRLGYHTVDLSVSYFGDALTLNMQGGFDVANERSGVDSPVVNVTRVLGGGDSAYFVDTMMQRISDRLLHILFIKPMMNPYEAVIKPASRETEQKRFDGMLSVLKNSKDPVFIHVHMLGTHGPQFEIRQQVFSAGQTQKEDWMTDFYDDAILSFDGYVGQLFDYLSASGQLSNTIVIVYSDHGERWKIYQRVPLLFWFPAGEYAGTIQANVQNIDVAPTILDYLNIPIPIWMDGQSLLKKEKTVPKYIFSASVDSNQIEIAKNGLWVVNALNQAPAFHELGYAGLVNCDQWFELYVQNPVLLYGNVKDYTYTCDPGARLTPQQAEHILLDHLSQNGYDISSLPAAITVQQYTE